MAFVGTDVVTAMPAADALRSSGGRDAQQSPGCGLRGHCAFGDQGLAATRRLECGNRRTRRDQQEAQFVAQCREPCEVARVAEQFDARLERRADHPVDAQALQFPRDVAAAAWKTTNELYAELSGKNEKWRKIYGSFAKFRDDQILWSRFAEGSFETMMLGMRSSGGKS